MQPGSLKTFHSTRRFLIVAACAAPLLVLGGAWWLVSEVLLVPTAPGDDTTADQLFTFIVHEKGLPRLNGKRREQFLEQQIRRLVQEAAYRDRFLACYRTAAPEDHSTFRANLFDAFKPLVMRDIRRFHELRDAEREGFLDGRVVEYGRLASFFGQVKINKSAFGNAAPKPQELLQLLFSKTTEEERQQGAAYFAAYAQRVSEILADAELVREFEGRIAATP